ncbi:hypothetical protein BKA70DRAFT_1438758 [Coprinopsis sp. MPI-PUGE-AT-0042]|nr:hypothetical protein BKA70DRAFT_1438758 [Coprinopsis sp. MPI-PUGE-AT-0042]
MPPSLSFSSVYTSLMVEEEWASLVVWLTSRLRAIVLHLTTSAMQGLSPMEWTRYWKSINTDVCHSLLIIGVGVVQLRKEMDSHPCIAVLFAMMNENIEPTRGDLATILSLQATYFPEQMFAAGWWTAPNMTSAGKPHDLVNEWRLGRCFAGAIQGVPRANIADAVEVIEVED